MRASRRLLLVALLVLGGCAPVVTHGPRVHPGARYALTGGWGWPLCDSLCADPLLPPIGAHAQYGFTPWGPEGVGMLVGATIPGLVLVPAAQLDLYLQLPALHDEVVYGGGVNASLAHVMPYLQLGRIGPTGSGWFTTQGFALASRRVEPEELLRAEVPLRGGVELWYWSPAVAYRFRIGSRRLTLYASGAWGRETVPTEWAEEVHPIRTITAGIGLETKRFPWPF